MKRQRPFIALSAAVAAAALVAAGLQGVGLAATPSDGHVLTPRLGPLVTGSSVRPAPTPRVLQAAQPQSAAAPQLPKPGAFTISLTGKASTPAVATRGRMAAKVSGAWLNVGSTGLAAAQAKGAAPVVSKVKVELLDPATVGRAGLTGLVLRLTRSDAGKSDGPVAVRIPSGVVRQFFGADYVARARWVQLPAAMTAATLASGKSKPVPVASSNQLPGSTVLTPSVGNSATLVAAAGSPVSSTGTGTWAATSLKTSSSWQVSTQSGDFEWSYPFRVPPAAAGPTPALALAYSSGSTDGETVSTNNQTSVVGEGWELAGTGFIERSFNGCSADGSGLSAPQSTSGDLCWNGDNDTISFGGHSGVLVPTGTAGSYRVQGDDGSRVDYLPHSTTCGDGGSDNGCWRLTTQDGTQYFFGRSATSAWTVPVFGDDPAEPCHASTFATSVCTQVWRWNLDFVQDLHGNAEQFIYHTELNYYHRLGGALVSYVRGGYLTEVDYGMRAGSSTVSQKVVLGYDTYGRCNQTVSRSTNCANESGSTFATPAHPTYYPDVPWDQNCVSGGACTGLVAPTFWTSQMLNTVTTSALVGATMTTADAWTLAHTFDNPGDTSAASMWLASISHPGLPDTTFGGGFMNNRVLQNEKVGGDTLAQLAKRRISTITTDTGGQLLVTYDVPDCTSANVGSITASTNTHQCFPQWWNPPGLAMQLDWFFKYRVNAVIQVPKTGGTSDPNLETHYIYTGTPAWRFDQSAATLGSQRTWSVFAGYSGVEVRQGSPNTPATQQTTDYRFFQGMNGDPSGPAHTPSSAHRGDPPAGPIQVTAGTHSVTDSLWWAGRTLETTVHVGSSGGTGASTTPVLSDTISLPWVSTPTGTGSFSYSYTDPVDSSVYTGSLAWSAYLTGDASTITSGTLADGSTRTTTSATTYDGYGRVTGVSSVTPDAGSTCTSTSYATDPTGHSDTALWLLNRPAQVSTVNLACGTTPNYPANAVSATRYRYDGAPASGDQALTTGERTETDAVTGYAGSTPVWVEQSHAAVADYDALGRLLRTYDANNHPTSTAYLPTGAGPVTSTVSSTQHNGATWGSTTTLYNTLWGKPTSMTDQNGNLSTASYDSTGRLSQVWLPDRLQSTHASSPSIGYAYKDIAGAALAVTTTRVNSLGGSTVSYAVMDGLGRPIQTQEAMDGKNSSGSPQITGTVITDTYYDGAGRAVLTDNPFGTTSVMPSAVLFNTATATQVPSQTQTSYDGAGRATAVMQLGLNPATGTYGPLFGTSYAYHGVDRVDTTPPSGGTYASTYTNSRGSTQYLDQYTTSSFAGTKERTTYGYDARGHMTSMLDQPGNHWTWSFDQLGRQVSAVDPDTGTTTSSYDAVGNVTDTTDGDGHKLHFSFDDLNRKITEAEWQAGPAGYATIAAWSYDGATLGKGLASGSTRYVGSTPTELGAAYTTAVTSYNADGNPLTNSLNIPAWAGSASPSTYAWSHVYDEAGDEATVSDPAAGGLAAENITTSFDLTGRLAAIVGRVAYVGNVVYTHTNQPSVVQMSNAATDVDRSYTYDDATARLTELRATTSAATGYHLADHLYTYDNNGDLTRDSNTADGQGTDTQCYGYDPLQELASAWTPAGGNCAAAPSSAALGGPAPYWSDYSYDYATGNRLSTTSHAVTGSGIDTKSTYSYPAAGAARPHGVSGVASLTAPAGSGTYTPVGSAAYGYDSGGNTTSRPGETLTWDSQNHATAATTAAGSGASVYDADGALLLQSDPATGSTLYLGDTEVHVAAGSSIVTGSRTYTAFGMPTAQRFTTPAAPTTVVLDWLDPSPLGQNTVDEEVDGTTLATTHRYFDPFGNARGAATAWSDSHTFLNAPTNPNTGTVHLGAREYDPAIGRFLSVDPVLDPSNPQQANGYSYAANNPVTSSDPTGLIQETETGARDCSHRQCVEAAINASYSNGLSAGDNVGSYDHFVSWANSSDFKWGNPIDFGAGLARFAGSTSDALSPSCKFLSFCPGTAASNRLDRAVGANQNSFAYSAPFFAALFAGPEVDIGVGADGAATAASIDASANLDGLATGIKLLTDPVTAKAADTADASLPGVAKGWAQRTADNGKGQVWQEPGATGNANSLRVMHPNAQYSNGYVRFYNEHGQPIGLDGKPGPNSVTHIPRGPDGTYPIPKGWDQ